MVTKRGDIVWYRTEEEVDAMLEDMISRSKGKYITQGVAFNKDSSTQMQLLKMALMSSYSFGGMMKELLGEKFSSPFSNNLKEFKTTSKSPIEEFKTITNPSFEEFKRFDKTEPEKSANTGVGNFL